MSNRTGIRWIVAAALLAAGGSVVGAPERRSDIPDDLQIPKQASAMKNPQAPSSDNLAQGKTYYTSQCAMCHGADGKGRGDLAVSMKMTVPDFTDPAVHARRTDGDLFYILTNGHGDMPGEGDQRLSERIRWNMILYVRGMKPGE